MVFTNQRHAPSRRNSATLPLIVLSLLAVILIVPAALADSALSEGVGRSAEVYDPAEDTKIDYYRQQALAPGEDIPLGGSREPDLVVDPNNPLNVCVASLRRLWVSTDGGNTFQGPTLPVVNAGQGTCGDPSLGYDSQGRLFWTYLGCTFDTAGNVSGIDLYIAQVNPGTGAIMAGYPVNITQQLGVPASAGNSHDKQWLAVDVYPGSPYTDRLYVVWTDLTGASTIWNTWSSDQGQNWSARVQLSGNNEGFVWPAHNTVAPNGDYYAAYHSQPTFSGSAPDGTSGRIWALRSTDGGSNFPQKNNPYAAGDADISFNVQSASNPIANAQFWLQGSAQPWILADPNTAGRMYCFAADDPDDDHSTGDASNVYMVVSTDNGVNWGAPVRIDDGPDSTFQVMPTASIDVSSGRLVAMYYDNRSGNTNAAGNFLLDVYMTYSEDGGNTWMNDFPINDLQFDPDPGAPTRFNGPPPTTRIGEYNGVATLGCDAFAAWCGNTLDGFGNATGQQIIFDKIRFDTFPPMISCPADIEVDNDPGVCGAVVTFDVAASDECQDTLAFDIDPPSGSFFEEGTTVVTAIVTNTIDLSDTCTFTVTVHDTTDPVVDCPSDLTFECDDIGPFGMPTATDNCDDDPDITLIVRDSVPGSCEQEYDLILTYEAEDYSGNTAQCQQTIMVIDTTPPVIACPDSLDVEFLTPSQAQIEFEATATDNCADNLMPVCDSASGSIFEIGHHDLSCSVGDGCGNTSTCSFGFHLVYFDIKPNSCPNPLHIKSISRSEGGGTQAAGTGGNGGGPEIHVVTNKNAVIPVAILGSDILDVMDLEVESITLNGVDPVSHSYQDVAGPAADVDAYCGCTTDGSDGYLDLTLRFDRDEIIQSLGPVSDGEVVQVIITGLHSDGDPFYGGDCFLIRSKGPHSSESGDDEFAETETALIGASPNPFNPTTTISFQLSQSAHYELTIYNIQGQVVTRFEGVGNGGVVDVVWDAGRYASGLYFYRLSAPGFTDTKKLMLIK